VSVSLRTFSRD